MESDKPHGKAKLKKHATTSGGRTPFYRARSDAQAEERSGAGKMNESTKYPRDQIVDLTGYTTDAEIVRGKRQVEKSPSIMRGKSSSHTTKTVVDTKKYPGKRRVIGYPSSSSDSLSNDSNQSISNDSDDSKTPVFLGTFRKLQRKEKLRVTPSTRNVAPAEKIQGKLKFNEPQITSRDRTSTKSRRSFDEKHRGKRKMIESSQLSEESSGEEKRTSCAFTLGKKAMAPEYKMVILSETSQALRLPSDNTTVTVRFRDTKEVYKMLWHGKEEKKYLGGKGWQSFLGNHGFKKGHRLKFTVLDPKKLEFEVASYIALPKRKGKCSAPTINDQKEDDEVDGGRGRGEPYHLEEKVKELRRPVSKLESNDGGHQVKKRKAEYVRQRAKKLSESQEQAQNGEQEHDEPSSKTDKILNELRDFKAKLPGMLLTMLGELGLTNISGPGGVGSNQRYLMRGDNTDKESEDESTN